jgi:predicted DNA-binding protein
MPKRSALPRQSVSIRLMPEVKRMLALLSEKNGLTQAAWLESMIRREAKRERVTAEEDEASTATAATTERQEAARARFQELMEKARAGFTDLTDEEIEAEVRLAQQEAREILRARGR